MSGDSEAARLLGSIHLTPIATVVTDPRVHDNPIVAANQAFTALTGYAWDEIRGRNCRFLAGADTDPSAQQQLRDAIARRQPALVELANYRKDGSAFRNAVMIAPVLDEAGELVFFVGSQMELADAQPDLVKRGAKASHKIAKLTPRQRQVLECLVQGHRNKQMAAQLGISEKTVKMHRAAMLERLGVPTSADAIRLGVEAALLD